MSEGYGFGLSHSFPYAQTGPDTGTVPKEREKNGNLRSCGEEVDECK